MPTEPDFSEFTDWLKHGHGDQWLSVMGEDPLSDPQKKIVADNATLLLDKNFAWYEKVNRFERALEAIENESTRNVTRTRYTIHFDHHTFPAGDHNFSYRHFPCSVSFTHVKFSEGDVSFEGATFGEGDVSFCHTKFESGHVNFSGAKFADGDVFFNNAKFGDGYKNFSKAIFRTGSVLFNQTEFGDGNIDFIATDFGNGGVRFEGTEFGEGDVQLHNAVFGAGDIAFNPRTIGSTALFFTDCQVAGNFFVKGHFIKPARFNLLKVAGTANFIDCIFDETPDFRDAKFDRPPEVAGMQVAEPKMRGRCPCRVAADKDDAPKLRKLKAMAIAASDHEKDGYFFALEMLAKRGVETKGFWPLLLDSLYAVLSGYGQSVWRPLIGFAASFGTFAFINSLFIPINALPWHKIRVFALEYSFHNTTPLFNTLFRFTPTPTDPEYISSFQNRMNEANAAADGWMNWIVGFSVLQQAIGAVLLFLLLLGLRNKFRMK